MRRTGNLFCERTRWQTRDAYVLGNELIRMVILPGGGHVAEFRFADASGLPTLNPLWIPSWKTIEPYRYRSGLHASRYGPPLYGKTASGIVGHNICLDYFGLPSEEEARQGLSIHGEAPCAKWKKDKLRVLADEAALGLSLRLPVAQLRFSREIEFRHAESVAYFRETVINERKADHFFHWTQHVTLSPPFLAPGESRVAISATKGMSYPDPQGYDAPALLASARQFRWPYAPARAGGMIDLTQPFVRRGFGYVAAALLDPQRKIQFVAAINHRYGVLMAYCFRALDFPWVTIWEENCGRTQIPWSGKDQARGLEFGTTPFPLGRRETFAMGPLFGTRTHCLIPARGRKTVHYVAFLAHVPSGIHDVRDIELAENEIVVRGARRKELARLPASGLGDTGLTS